MVPGPFSDYIDDTALASQHKDFFVGDSPRGEEACRDTILKMFGELPFGIGGSFESYASESLILAGADRCGAQFYREKGREGEDEIDLILNFPSQGGRLVAIEFKVGTNQSAKKGFYSACAALNVRDRFVVHSGDEPYLGNPVDRLDLKTAIAHVAGIAREG
jgi:hypothetical protein